MGLYSKITDLQKLSRAWEKVRSNNPSAGTDQISCAQFDANSRIELKQLNYTIMSTGFARYVLYHWKKKKKCVRLAYIRCVTRWFRHQSHRS